ncbi:murein hydrolase activator EnvC family protein [Aestuariivirga litoralis]|uniref:murein hydrolase activator EnvC family protein n=1 Tax=Aestuariivirga litoralis TaxID=2650924 RepID=UPI0018C4ABF1|nr:peptidoglycan DD-metalloendopeptidase family protein [Aestuariivirga litoralis]
MILAAFTVIAAPLWAATPEETQAQLQAVQDTLSQSTAKVSEISAAIAAANKAQGEISKRLVDLEASMEDQQVALTEQDQHLKDLEAQSVTLASDLAARQDEMSGLLAGLMRLQQNPPPALVVAPENALDALRGAMMFGAVVPGLRDKAKALRDNLDELHAVRDETDAARQKQKAALDALASSETELKTLQDQKRAFAIAARKDLADEKTRAAALADQAKNLQQLLVDLQQAREEAERKKSEEAKAAAKAEAERLAALQGPLKLLSTLKGKLPYPVAGAIIKRFGEDTELGTKLDGLAIAAESNSRVISPADGTVEFAGTFRSYGQLLILNAGEGYLVLLAGMKQISAEMGQTVRVGEPVGLMGDGPSTLALLGETADHTHPVFYVEFRKDNAPVDSTTWWDAGRREAMK